jgi:hypothetical protein
MMMLKSSALQADIDKKISKLHQQNQSLQEDAIEEISIFFHRLPLSETQIMESTCLQLADIFNFNATNRLRSLIATLIFCKYSDKIQ